MRDDSPATSFKDLTLDAFVERLASAEPVPGGGSASAIAGALGAALVAMVGALSAGRPKYAAHADLHAQAIEVGHRLAARLLALADRDATAYAEFANTLKMPRETEEQTAARREAMRRAARHASDIPMETAEACLELVVTAELLVGRSNVNAASDLNVAALLGEAAARGAGENVLVNLPAVADEAYEGEMTARVQQVLHDVEELAAAIHEAVRSGDTREPLLA